MEDSRIEVEVRDIKPTTRKLTVLINLEPCELPEMGSPNREHAGTGPRPPTYL